MSFRCLRLSLAFGAVSSVLLAQVPVDQAVILEIAGPPGIPRCMLADATAMGLAVVPPTPVALALPFVPTAVAVDPGSPQQLWLLGPVGGPGAGIHTVPIGPFATAVGPVSGQAWSQSGGTRLRVGDTHVVTLRQGGIVEWTPKAGGAPVVLMQRADAVDVAVIGIRVFVACRDAGNPTNLAPLFEVDPATGVQRLVGSYPDLLCVGASNEFFPRLALGTGFGVAVEIDPATGAVGNVLPATGPVVRIGFWRWGPMFWAVPTTAGFDVWSVSGRVYERPVGTLLDLDFSAAPTPSVVPFGDGCGAGIGVAWNGNGLPRIGNASFALSLGGAPAGQPLAVFFGANAYNRWFAPSLGIVLPLDLGALAPGCSLLVDPAVVWAAAADAAGTVTLALPVPADPFLVGTDWSGQAFVLDPSVGPLGLASSTGVVCRLDR